MRDRGGAGGSRVHCEAIDRAGERFVVREADLADAPQILAHARTTLAEPEWNITEPQEFTVTLDQEREWIAGFRSRAQNIALVADYGIPGRPAIVGVLSFSVQQRLRVRHRGRLGIAVARPFRRRGVGEALLSALLEWTATAPEVERIELSVFAHNQAAIALYRKVGFVEEARLARAFKLADGRYFDEVMMVMWVKEQQSPG